MTNAVAGALGSLRSILMVPGDDRHKAAKAAASAADAVLLDLEDSVPASGKAGALERLRESVSTIDWRRKYLICRTNPIGSKWFASEWSALTSMAGRRPDAFMIPKVNHGLELPPSTPGAAGEPALVALVEDALGFVNLGDLCRSGRFAAIAFGAGDFAASLGMTVPGNSADGPYSQVRAQLAVHAKAFGLAAFDTPSSNFKDLEAFEKESAWARSVGFDGKLAIHPAQVEIINRVFSPSPREVEWAVRVTSVLDDRSLGTVDGSMVDEATRRSADCVLGRARRFGLVAA